MLNDNIYKVGATKAKVVCLKIEHKRVSSIREGNCWGPTLNSEKWQV